MHKNELLLLSMKGLHSPCLSGSLQGQLFMVWSEKWPRFTSYNRDICTFLVLNCFWYMLKTTAREETGIQPGQKCIKNRFSWGRRDDDHHRDSLPSFRNVFTLRSWKKTEIFLPKHYGKWGSHCIRWRSQSWSPPDPLWQRGDWNRCPLKSFSSLKFHDHMMWVTGW